MVCVLVAVAADLGLAGLPLSALFPDPLEDMFDLLLKVSLTFIQAKDSSLSTINSNIWCILVRLMFDILEQITILFLLLQRYQTSRAEIPLMGW